MLSHSVHMKRPPFIQLPPKAWLRSLGVQTSLELAAGGILTAMFLRWVSM